VVAAAAVVAVLIAISGSGGDQGGAASGGRVVGTAEVTRLFRGIPQHGETLGRPDAPVTMVEFADLQCPFCAEYARDALPTMVDRYVRTGRVRLELRLISILGPDSEPAARTAAAAALQDRTWQFAELFYRNQGQENPGYVTDDFLRSLLEATPGLDVQGALAASRGPEAGRLTRDAETAASQQGVNATPTFFAGRTGGPLRQLQVSSLTPDAFTGPLDQLLKR
jgi:protein-disulfide isomerase